MILCRIEQLFEVSDALLDQLGHLPTRGEGTRASSVKGAFITADGKWVALSAAAEGIVRKLFYTIGSPEVLDDPRFASYELRLGHRTEINDIIGRWIAQRTSLDVLSILRSEGVTVAPVLSTADARRDPHFIAREVYLDVPGRDGEPETIAMHNVVPRMSGTPSGLRRPAPRLGEHNDEILAELGISAETRTDLALRGVLGAHAHEVADV